MNGQRVALQSRSSGKFLDGRSHNNEVAFMTNRNPTGDAYLQWTFMKINDVYAIKSVSSNCFLDGRNHSNEKALVTNRYPNNDLYLQWRLIPTGDGDWFVLQSCSSGCFLDGRGGEEEALVTNRNWHGDHFFYFRFVYP